MSRRHEYTLDEFWAELREVQPDNFPKILFEESDFLDALLCFITVGKERFIEKFNQTAETERFSVLQHLIRLYPLTAEIIEELVVNNKELQNDKDNFTRWFDVSEVMLKSSRKFLTLFSTSQNTNTQLEKIVENLQKKREELSQKILEEKKLQASAESLHSEVAELEREFAQLQEEWSEESLNAKKQNLLKETKKIREKQELLQQQLNGMNDDLEKFKNKRNTNFEKALKALGDALSAINEGDD